MPIDSYFSFYDDPFAQGAADIALTQAAVHILKARQPALLALHLLVTDKVQHEFGPDHYLSHAALTTADHCVGLIRDGDRGGRPRRPHDDRRRRRPWVRDRARTK